MLQLVLILAIVNLCLGYGLAIYLHDFRRPLTRAPRFPQTPAPSAAAPDRVSAPLAVPEPSLPVSQEPIPEIPREWLDVLDGVVESNSFVEASIHVLKLEVSRYRKELVDLDRELRNVLRNPTEEAIRACLVQLKLANADWLNKQSSATSHLQKRQGSLQQFADLGAKLEQVLLEQAAQIETTGNNIECLDFTSDPAVGGQRLLVEIGRLLDLCHQLRDQMQESLVAVLQQEGRLAGLSRQAVLDGMTGLGNLCALRHTLDNWLRENASGKRVASLAIVDVDALRPFNDAYGPEIGDRLLRACGQITQQAIRKARGFDRAFRYLGGSIVVFFGDTGPRSATSAVERVRQTVAGCQFELHGEPLTPHVSAGVVEVLPGDTSESLLRNAGVALREAKKTGRNRTCLRSASGFEPISPPELHITRRTYRLQALEEFLEDEEDRDEPTPGPVAQVATIT